MMRKFVIKELVLYSVAVVALYLTSYFHFYGPNMWYKGAIPEAWLFTTKFVVVSLFLILPFIFLCLKVKSMLIANLMTGIFAIAILPWIGYSLLSSLDIFGYIDGFPKYMGWLMGGLSNVSLFFLLLFGREFMVSNIKATK